MTNTLSLLSSIVTRLNRAGMTTIVFGGWAEELAGRIQPRPHHDIDLLFFAQDFSTVDEFLHTQADLREILPKRFSHKRAFLCDGIMVELMLVRKENKSLVTTFWDEYELRWPELNPMDISVPPFGTISVAHPSIIDFYREHSLQIDSVRSKHLSPQSS